MNDITFTKGAGGVPKTLAGEDHISGMVVYLADADLPSGFTTTARIKSFATIEAVEAAGIVATSTVWKIKALHYHLSEFFRMAPDGIIYVGLFKTPVSTYDYAEIKTLQNFADGRIRQCGVFLPDVDFAASIITGLQGVATLLEAQHMPLSIMLAANVDAVSGLAAVAATGQANVSVIIGQDGDGVAATLFADETSGASVTCLGLALGAVSKAAVNECIAWVLKFPSGISNPALCDGSIISEIDQSVLTELDTKRFIFLRKLTGIAGSYFNDSHTMDVATSDYAYIEAVRTIDKAIRGIRTYVLPYLAMPIYVNPDTGKLRQDTVSFLEDLGGQALIAMEKAGELSGYRCVVDPEQNVLQSSTVDFNIVQVGVGVMRKVSVKIGYTTKLS